MKYFISGACGFIGTTLSRKLLEMGHEVLGVDALTDNYSLELKNRNMQLLSEYENFKFANVDLLNCKLEPLLDGVSGVFHLAGHPSVQNSWGEGFQTYIDRNILATQRLLMASLVSRVAKFVNSSSSSVYGRAIRTPTREEDPKNPVSPYGVTKLAAEQLCSLYGSEFGLNTVSLRYFTVYGPRQRPDMAFNKLINAGIQGTPFPLHGDGTQVRDFTFVEDVANANICALKAQTNPGDVFNIGGGSPVTMKDAVMMLEEIMSLNIQIQAGPLGPGNPMITEAECAAAHQVLNWEPQVNIFEGLKRQVEWQLNQK